jgi:hypothetical protein
MLTSGNYIRLRRLSSSSGALRRTQSPRAASVPVKDSDDNVIVSSENGNQIPLPSPLLDVDSGEDLRPTAVPLTSLYDLPTTSPHDASAAGVVNLDKNQSIWLLNLVSFLYGTNTTCVPLGLNMVTSLALRGAHRWCNSCVTCCVNWFGCHIRDSVLGQFYLLEYLWLHLV